jgi:hypothetical protein
MTEKENNSKQKPLTPDILSEKYLAPFVTLSGRVPFLKTKPLVTQKVIKEKQ